MISSRTARSSRNAAFDFAFVNWHFGDCGHPVVCHTRMVDTLAIARARHPGAKHSLDALCTRFGIDRSQRVKHGALIDAQLLAQVYVELTGGRQIHFLMPEAAPAIAEGERPDRAGAPIEVAVRPARPHSASDEELLRHAAFVATLADPLWLAG